MTDSNQDKGQRSGVLLTVGLLIILALASYATFFLINL